MKISENPTYQKDVKRFDKAIQLIENKKRQSYYMKVFNEFKALTEIIDNNHNSMANAKIQPLTIRDNVKDLQDLRYQLNQLCKDLNIR